MDGKKGLAISVIMIFVILCVVPSWAVNGKSNRATLRGLKGIGVLVEQLPPEVEKGGLSKDQLQKDVETKLRAAGIKVLTKEECAKTPGEPNLYINVNVNIAKTESDIYPYSLDLLFIQKVSLLRDQKITSHAVTWSTAGVGSITKTMVSQLRESVGEILDIFIKAYRAENPK
jgi:hypothetical protein